MSIPESGTFGRYRVIREIGRGGEAVVYLAEDDALRRLVAIKTFPFALGRENAEGPSQFRQEVEALLRLDHPGICRIHDAGIESGIPFIAMSYVEGVTLGGMGNVTPAEAIRIVAEVARIVEAAHGAGVVHGDLSPQNLVVTPDGRCVVLDFGVSLLLDETHPDSAIHGGTLPYLAPERLHQRPDAKSDVYGLGAVLFELVTRRTPFTAPTRAGLLEAMLSDDTPLARSVEPKVDRDLEAVLARALARDPARRYPDMRAFASDLEALARGARPSVRRQGILARGMRLARRRPAAVGLAAFAIVFLAAWSVVAIVKNRKLAANLERAKIESGRAISAEAAAEDHLVRHARLADARRLQDLQVRARRLVPPRPEIVDALLAWQADASGLTRKLEGYVSALEELRRRGRKIADRPGEGVSRSMRREVAALTARHAAFVASGPGDADRAAAEPILRRHLAKLEKSLAKQDDWSYETDADAWQDATLSTLIEGLKRLGGPAPAPGTLADVARRLDDAGRVESSLAASRDRWEAARSAIADPQRSPRYGGLRIDPQIGLVPIGPNPDTGLWEFEHVLTGPKESAAASRDAAQRPIVLVLVPGGRALMGAQKAQGDPSAAHVEEGAAPTEGPVHEVVLDPFFISKFEMTEGQWFRALGKGGSPQPFPGLGETDLPVRFIDWHEASRALLRVGLELPTEAQWEYAARAGTTTPWWTGSDAAALSDAEVFGTRAVAPVGSKRPNAFGLYDVGGNAAEWCRDRFARYEDPTLPGTGERSGVVSPPERIVRGGTWLAGAPTDLRSARRMAEAPSARRNHCGVRPARGVEPWSAVRGCSDGAQRVSSRSEDRLLGPAGGPQPAMQVGVGARVQAERAPPGPNSGPRRDFVDAYGQAAGRAFGSTRTALQSLQSSVDPEHAAVRTPEAPDVVAEPELRREERAVAAGPGPDTHAIAGGEHVLVLLEVGPRRERDGARPLLGLDRDVAAVRRVSRLDGGHRAVHVDQVAFLEGRRVGHRTGLDPDRLQGV